MLIPFAYLRDGAFFVVPNEKEPHLWRKRDGQPTYAWARSRLWLGFRLREDRSLRFPADSSLLVIEVHLGPFRAL